MQSKASTIKAYLESESPDRRAILKQLDACIREAAPEAVGSMQYGMPTYAIGDKLVAYNAQKNYFSLYADPTIVAQYKRELANYSVGKSCIRFPALDPKLQDTLKKIIARYMK